MANIGLQKGKDENDVWFEGGSGWEANADGGSGGVRKCERECEDGRGERKRVGGTVGEGEESVREWG